MGTDRSSGECSDERKWESTQGMASGEAITGTRGGLGMVSGSGDTNGKLYQQGRRAETIRSGVVVVIYQQRGEPLCASQAAQDGQLTNEITRLER